MGDVVTRPGGKSPDVYDKTLRGHYGEFTSDASFSLSFIQTAVRIEDIGILQTATEAFSSSSLDFEELIQRDIDQKRVKDIVDKYLKMGKDRVLFFPPLLVSLVAVESNQLIPYYETVTHNKDNEDIYTTWGNDRFQLIIPTSQDATGYNYSTDGVVHYSNPYWSVLRVNTNKIALVVIDGQHRLSALKYLWNSNDPNNKKVVKNISIPICVLFPPDAITGNAKHETVNRDLRELFVRINSTAKQVSGHFITLLDDKSLSSLAIRAFCEKCKNTKIGDGYTNLNLIEWNQRETKLSSQINRRYAISTIQIIADTLKEYAFDPGTGGLTSVILNLPEYKQDFDCNDCVPIDQIAESNFASSQIDLLENIIDQKITPSLQHLFFSAKPYATCIKSFTKAAADLDSNIGKDIEGAVYFKEKVLQQYRDVNDFDPREAKTAQDSFIKSYDNAVDIADRVYLLNVFQQGYLRVWLQFSSQLSVYEIDPVAIARILVSALDPVCFNSETNLFDSERMFLQKLLYNGTRIIVTKKSKLNWMRLIMATLLNPESIKVLRTKLHEELGSDTNAVVAKIEESARSELCNFVDDLRDAYYNDYHKNWSDKDFSAQTIKDLEVLSERMKDSDPDARMEFEEKIKQFTEMRLEEAKSKLYSALRI